MTGLAETMIVAEPLDPSGREQVAPAVPVPTPVATLPLMVKMELLEEDQAHCVVTMILGLPLLSIT